MAQVRVRAGDFRQRVTIQSPAEVRDAHGGFSMTWTNAATVWASVRPLAGDERVYGGGFDSDITHEVRMRYNSNLAGATQPTAWRLRHDSRSLNIKHILNSDERKIEHVLLCREDTS